MVAWGWWRDGRTRADSGTDCCARKRRETGWQPSMRMCANTSVSKIACENIWKQTQHVTAALCRQTRFLLQIQHLPAFCALLGDTQALRTERLECRMRNTHARLWKRPGIQAGQYYVSSYKLMMRLVKRDSMPQRTSSGRPTGTSEQQRCCCSLVDVGRPDDVRCDMLWLFASAVLRSMQAQADARARNLSCCCRLPSIRSCGMTSNLIRRLR